MLIVSSMQLVLVNHRLSGAGDTDVSLGPPGRVGGLAAHQRVAIDQTIRIGDSVLKRMRIHMTDSPREPRLRIRRRTGRLVPSSRCSRSEASERSETLPPTGEGLTNRVISPIVCNGDEEGRLQRRLRILPALMALRMVQFMLLVIDVSVVALAVLLGLSAGSKVVEAVRNTANIHPIALALAVRRATPLFLLSSILDLAVAVSLPFWPSRVCAILLTITYTIVALAVLRRNPAALSAGCRCFGGIIEVRSKRTLLLRNGAIGAVGLLTFVNGLTQETRLGVSVVAPIAIATVIGVLAAGVADRSGSNYSLNHTVRGRS